MKYYETDEPFYSVITASDMTEALKLYRQQYGDGNDPEKFYSLNRDEALDHIAVAKKEDRNYRPYDAIKATLDRKVPAMLLIDGDIA